MNSVRPGIFFQVLVPNRPQNQGQLADVQSVGYGLLRIPTHLIKCAHRRQKDDRGCFN